MADNRYLDPSDLEVDVQNGDVVLTGTVNDRYAKRVAYAISETAYGVNNVENRLRVRKQGEGK